MKAILQHTPGKWVADDLWVYADGDCYHHPIADCSVNVTCREVGEGQANARLIAAAPDLLEALGRAIDAMEQALDHATDGTETGIPEKFPEGETIGQRERPAYIPLNELDGIRMALPIARRAALAKNPGVCSMTQPEPK